ncbi:hypothetical protein BB561_006689 [Smittium simulii]|uniref:Uncharacterized protein n=1 Tax=Smittium simulii TaxID=133385 RepID=A0A2T9Y2D5_9FUNG|nr:hypothetical protein BB561_006689 [Smittium simulii]
MTHNEIKTNIITPFYSEKYSECQDKNIFEGKNKNILNNKTLNPVKMTSVSLSIKNNNQNQAKYQTQNIANIFEKDQDVIMGDDVATEPSITGNDTNDRLKK